MFFFLEFPEYPDRYANPEADNIRTNRQNLKQQVTAGKKAHMDVRTETL